MILGKTPLRDSVQVRVPGYLPQAAGAGPPGAQKERPSGRRGLLGRAGPLRGDGGRGFQAGNYPCEAKARPRVLEARW